MRNCAEYEKKMKFVCGPEIAFIDSDTLVTSQTWRNRSVYFSNQISHNISKSTLKCES